MSKFTRFQPPRAEDEFYFCPSCGQEFYYTLLDELGVCPQCRKDKWDEVVEEEEAWE